MVLSLVAYFCLKKSPSSVEESAEEVTEKAEVIDTASAPTKKSAPAIGSQHLQFKGVPIDGTLRQFVKRMKQKGFTEVDSNDDTAVLSGDFAGHKDCKVYVWTLDGKDLVAQIGVVFSDRDQWKQLYGDYARLKEMLTKKYGSPAACTEKFQKDFSGERLDDHEKMYKVELDKCQYETRYETDKGTILLEIAHDGVLRCFVLLRYKDKINGRIVDQQAADDL